MYLFLFFSCSDHLLTKKVFVEEEQELYPDIVLIPESISFGHLISGTETGIEAVTILNSGQDTLEISDINLSEDPRISYSGLNIHSLEAGEKVEFFINYSPITYESINATLNISSNDPDEPSVSLGIDGYGDAPVIYVSPEDNSISDIYVGCSESAEIEIGNNGNLDLVIDDATLWISMPNDFAINWLYELPITISPNDYIYAEVEYTPSDIGVDSSILSISSNDPVNENVSANIFSNGLYYQTFTDSFIQEKKDMVDILFVIDNSGSMNLHQTELANNMSSFMSVFSTLSVDYQIAMITTDSPYFVGDIIDQNNPDPVSELSSQISGMGIYGSAMEQGLYESYVATQPGGDAGPGSTFLRDDASLIFVYVSDEPDHSPDSWNDYALYFNTLKSDISMITAHSVIGDYPAGCTWTNGAYSRTIQYGAYYYDITQYYGGTAYSLCALDWGQQMQSMAQNSIPVLSYELLNEVVIENTVDVYVDGIQNTFWTYESSSNSIEFTSDYSPQEGSLIEIIYSIYGECND